MKPVIFMRNSAETLEEAEIASQYFDIFEYVTEIPRGSLVIPRYSALPFYNEMERNINNLGSQLIQSYEQHKYIADFGYYEDIKDLTFETWRLGDTSLPDVPLVVKGATNSKKWNWNTQMFAKDKVSAVKIAANLSNDGLIGYQDILLRRYVPLKTFEIGINGLPFTNEYRFFFFKGELIATGYYWSIIDELEGHTDVPPDAVTLAIEVSDRVKGSADFYVIDVAEKEEGGFICVELNDGTMSGLSTIAPHTFYEKLSFTVSKFEV